MTRIALLSTSDTDLLSARSSGAEYAMANPSRLDLDALPGLLTSADLVAGVLGGLDQGGTDQAGGSENGDLHGATFSPGAAGRPAGR